MVGLNKKVGKNNRTDLASIGKEAKHHQTFTESVPHARYMQAKPCELPTHS